MQRFASRKELEDECFDLERETNIQDDLNEENVEETTLNYATKVAKSEELVHQAYDTKSVKCFNIDTKICHNISVFSKTLTQFIRTENKVFNPKLFAEKLVTFFNPSARVETNENSDDDETPINRGFELEDFLQLGKQLPNLINEVPIFHYTFGSFTPEIDQKALIKERKQRVKRDDFTNEETTKPRDYEEVRGQVNEDVVTEEIDHLLSKIKKKVKNSRHDNIEFYDAIIDKDCLTSSVTNIFHSAFMVKEGMLLIEAKDNKNMVRTVTDEESKNLTELPRRQQVLRFNKTTFDNWRKMHNDF